MSDEPTPEQYETIKKSLAEATRRIIADTRESAPVMIAGLPVYMDGRPVTEEDVDGWMEAARRHERDENGKER